MIDAAAAARHADQLLRHGKLSEARLLIETLLREAPDFPIGWLLRARLLQLRGEFSAMLEAARRALTLAPSDTDAILVCAEAEILAGETADARARLLRLAAGNANDPITLRRIANFFTQLNAHADADRCAQAALYLAPSDVDAQYHAASAALAMGRLDDAERLFESVIAKRPTDFDAAYNRTTLRRQTTARNHVAALQTSLARFTEPPYALRYALAKELEDLGQLDASFDQLERGASARRKQLAYKVEADTEAMAAIETAFGADFFARAGAGYEDEAPIFVVGLPRTGTTLVDRILNRHPRVESRGELNDLALAVMRAAPASTNKADRITRTAAADMRALGASYCRAVRGAGASGAIFLDKTPLNFLYLGIIARALPNAKIVHLTRHPMASGYAMLKTLFRMGYPFSYDQDDIGRYQLSYMKLMRHWRAHLGARILDISYEALVENQEQETRRLLAFCGLDWADECLAFNEAFGPSATASAAQVRQPMYRDSLEQWRGVAHRLAPLAARLQAGGVDIA